VSARKRERQTEADRIDCELRRLADAAERVGLLDLASAIDRARGAAREHMTEAQRQAAPGD